MWHNANYVTMTWGLEQRTDHAVLLYVQPTIYILFYTLLKKKSNEYNVIYQLKRAYNDTHNQIKTKQNSNIFQYTI